MAMWLEDPELKEKTSNATLQQEDNATDGL